MTNPITERITKALDIINSKDESNMTPKKTGGVKRGRVVLAIIGVIYLTHYFTSQRINDELGLSRLNELTTEVNKLSSQIESLDKDKLEKQAEVNEVVKLLEKRNAELTKIKNEIESKQNLIQIKQQQIKKINTAIWYVKDAASVKDTAEGKSAEGKSAEGKSASVQPKSDTGSLQQTVTGNKQFNLSGS